MHSRYPEKTLQSILNKVQRLDKRGVVARSCRSEHPIHFFIRDHLHSRGLHQPKRNRRAIRSYEHEQFTRSRKHNDEVISARARGSKTHWRGLRSERLQRQAARLWNADSSAERTFCRGQYFRGGSRAIRGRCIRASHSAFLHDREQLRVQPANGVFFCPSQRWNHLGARAQASGRSSYIISSRLVFLWLRSTFATVAIVSLRITDERHS